MKPGLAIKNGIVIPFHELIITASRSGGPGGQHVNKSSTRITVRWNVIASTALTENQKELIASKLASEINQEGEIIVNNSESRSQLQNKDQALSQLAQKIRKALHVQKKRMQTKVPKGAKEARLQKKKQRSELKKRRQEKIW